MNNPDTDLMQRVRRYDTDPVEPAMTPPVTARRALIQDGQALARDLYRIAEMLRDGNWTLLRMQADHYAVRLDEAGNACKELGA